MQKRIFSMLLAIVMVVGLIPGGALTAFAAETVTLYFNNTQNWAAVYIFTWADSEQMTGDWPGCEMTNQGNGIWSYDVPAGATMVIFNNGIGGSGGQTSDLTIPSDGSNLYDFSTNTWSVYGTTPDNPDPVIYTVTVSADPSVGGTVYGGGTYEENSFVTVSAVAADAYTFVGWYINGALVGTDAEYTFTVTADVTLTAIFEPNGEEPNPGTGSGEDYDLSVFHGTRTDFRDESVYTLLISRFYDGDSSNNVRCWDDDMAGNPPSDPAWRGDFKGLIKKLDYIKALGFTAVRLNSVVQSASGYDYHGFHPINLMDIDFRLESDGYTYEDLIDACHARGLKVIQGVNLNNTSNFGEEYLRKLFEVNEDANWSSITDSLIPTETLLAQYPDYAELTPIEQYNARLDMLKNSLNSDKYYHTETSMSWDNYLEQQGQIAGDCVDINTENPEVALYLAESCAWYAQMGVDAVLIDNAKHINRWTFNEGILPLLSDLLEKAGLELDIFCEIGSRARETWNHNNPSSSVPFYSWAETEEEWQNKWNDKDPTANIQTSIDHYNAHDTLEEFEVPTSDNALLNGITYHTPDYSQSSGMHAFDFTMMWNFENVYNAFGAGVTGDKYMNDATWNLLSVDNWDHGPDGMDKTRYSMGVSAWKQNLNLMFTFRGIPSILYGSEIEFAKNLPIDVGPNAPLANTGRAYYGDHLKGRVTATGFGEYEADGTVATTLNSELSQHIRMLNELRQKIPALRKGQYTTDRNYISGNIAFIRRYTDADIDSLALVTLTDGATFKNIPNGKYVDAVSGDIKNVTNGTLTVPSPGSTDLAVYVCCADGFTGLDAELSPTESVLRFNVDGDTTKVSAITTVNGEAKLPAAPELPYGYDFLGWIVNGKEYKPGETVAISVDSMARANLIKEYPLWVGGKQVTSTNLTITGGSGTATYDPETNTLTLDNYTYTGTGYGNAAIYYNDENIFTSEAATLNLILKNENTVTHTGGGDSSYGVYAYSTLVISGDGSLTATGGNVSTASKQSVGIKANMITIQSGTVTANGGSTMGVETKSIGISADSVTIQSGNVNAKGGFSLGYSIGIFADSVTISGGTVITSGDGSTFVHAAFSIASVSIDKSLAVYDANDEIIETPDWTKLAYAKIAESTIEANWGVSADALTERGTLAEAVSAVKNNTADYIQLQKDITLSGTLQFDNSVTLDLNGRTLTATGDYYGIYVNGDLTVKDSSTAGNGKLSGQSSAEGSIGVNASSITVSGGSLSGTAGAYGIYTDAGITVSGGSLTGTSTAEYGYGIFACGSITVSDGSLSGQCSVDGSSGVYANNNITVSGGSLTGTSFGMMGGVQAIGAIIVENDGIITAICVTPFTIADEEYSSYRVQSITDNNDGTKTAVLVKPYAAELKGTTLTLEGNIGLDFLYQFNDAALAANEEAFVRFTHNGETDIPVAEAVKDTTTQSSKTLYKFTYKLNAKNMTDTVQVQVFDGSTPVSKAVQYSVRDNALAIIGGNQYSQKAKDVATAMLHYGAYAQTYFGHNSTNPEDLANAELGEQDLDEVKVETFDNYSASRTVVKDVGEFVGSTLVLNSETTLKAYFVPAEGVDISDLTFTAVLGNEAVTVKRLEDISDGRYVLVIENIPAQHLNDKYTITVTKGSDSGTFSIAALDYCGNVIRKATSENASENYPQYTDALVNLLKSMYLYNQAAETYFKEN